MLPMVLTVFAGIAEFERSLIATRTEEGRRVAQARGVLFGRPPKLRPDQRTLARHLIDEGKSVSEVARTFNVHAATIYRCLHHEAPYDSTPFRSHARSRGAPRPLWPITRQTANRQVGALMRTAGIEGPQACPRGLRHSDGVAAVTAGVPLPTVAAVLGHASLTTTALYTTAIGAQARELVSRVWA